MHSSEIIGIMFWMIPAEVTLLLLVVIAISTGRWWVPLCGLPIYIGNAWFVFLLSTFKM
jgi:hypothetical protein